VLLVLCCALVARAQSYSEGFDGSKVTWQIRTPKNAGVRIASQRRDAQVRHSGKASEYVEIESTRHGTHVRLEHDLPAAIRIDDLDASLWFLSNRGGATLSLRVVFPHEKDPRTGQTLSALIHGDIYQQVRKWQRLTCAALETQFNNRVRLLRAELRNPNINISGAFVDGAVMTMDVPAGKTQMFIDDLKFGPVVPPRDIESAGRTVQAVPADSKEQRPVVFRLDRLTVEGEPFFPLITAYHHEPVQFLDDAGFNVVWIPDYEDENLLTALREQQLWAIAAPPRPTSAAGGILAASRATIMPFSMNTRGILFWYVGTRIPPRARDELIGYCQQTRSSDRLLRRPLAADVSGDERVFSRKIELLATSRHVTNTTFDYKQQRNYLSKKRLLARRGSFLWTWTQVEPASDNAEWRAKSGLQPVVIEPEQVRAQVFAALSAGVRGLGFWKTGALDEDSSITRERVLTIAQINHELKLVEPYLATGTPTTTIPFTIAQPAKREIGQRALDFRSSEPERREGRALLRDFQDRTKQNDRLSQELEATLIKSDAGTLMIAAWYQNNSQFVPGRMAGNDAKIRVEGVPETVLAWEITTTRIRLLKKKPVPGGIEITIPRFDQTAMVFLTTDQKQIVELKQRMRQIAPHSARIAVELAKMKLARVREVDQQLHDLGHPQPDAPQTLARAEEKLRQAEALLVEADAKLTNHGQRGNHSRYEAGESYHQARELSGEVMQYLRILQRAHFNDAVRDLASPVSSPYTVCFQTLPDHYRMVSRIGRSSIIPDAELLPSGNFEDSRSWISAGWKHAQNAVSGVRAGAALSSDAKVGNHCLRLHAVPETQGNVPNIVPRRPVFVTSPSIPIQRGQIIHISGWVRVVNDVQDGLDGAMLYDSIAGPVGSLRWQTSGEWQRFEIIREVQETGDFNITLSLAGMGIVDFDDLHVIPHNPSHAKSADELPENPRSTPLRLWERLPGFRRQKSTPELSRRPNRSRRN